MNKFNFKKSRNHLEEYEEPSSTVSPHVPDALCTRCPQCGAMLFTADLNNNGHICPQCQHHFRLSAVQRIALVCDEGTFTAWDNKIQSCDPLQFPGYTEKLENSRQKSGLEEAVLTGEGCIEGYSCALFAMEADFMMGSMGSVVGEKITRLFERATENRLPVIGFTMSGGARMQEGIYSLMQMAKTSGAVKHHSDAGLLYTAVLCNPTTGGVTASFAMEGDILLAEPGALIAFAGPRVVEQTIRQKLPKGFQKAEFLLDKGFLDAIVSRQNLKSTLAQILHLHREA